jgi:FkbM family methyltransferase
MGLVSTLHHKVRTTPWLGRFALQAIPDLRWHVSVEPVGKFEIRLRRNRGYWLRSPLSNDGFMMGALTRLIKPGDVIYDIGANIGLYSRFLVQKFQASRVYAFEPAQANRPQLARNLVFGDCSEKVTIMPLAVGDEDGSTEFQVDDISSHAGTLNAVTHGGASSSRSQYNLPPVSETVQVRRLDSLIRDENMKLPNVMKIDIEGAEAMALRGGMKLLRERGPNLVIELHGAPVAVEVLKVLWECDYHCFGYLETSAGTYYKELEASDLPLITEKYSLHFVAASKRADDLIAPITDPEWIH